MTTILSRLYDFIFLHSTSKEASETDDAIDLFSNFIPEIAKYYCRSFDQRHFYIRVYEEQENLVTLLSLY